MHTIDANRTVVWFRSVRVGLTQLVMQFMHSALCRTGMDCIHINVQPAVTNSVAGNYYGCATAEGSGLPHTAKTKLQHLTSVAMLHSQAMPHCEHVHYVIWQVTQ